MCVSWTPIWNIFGWGRRSCGTICPCLLLVCLSVEKSKGVFSRLLLLRKICITAPNDESQSSLPCQQIFFFPLLKLCKEKHSKDKCPPVQREWEEFIKKQGERDEDGLERLHSTRCRAQSNVPKAAISKVLSSNTAISASFLFQHWNVLLICLRHTLHTCASCFLPCSLGHWRQQSAAPSSIY